MLSKEKQYHIPKFIIGTYSIVQAQLKQKVYFHNRIDCHFKNKIEI